MELEHREPRLERGIAAGAQLRVLSNLRQWHAGDLEAEHEVEPRDGVSAILAVPTRCSVCRLQYAELLVVPQRVRREAASRRKLANGHRVLHHGDILRVRVHSKSRIA